MINKLTKKGLTEAVVGQIVKDLQSGDLTALTELISLLPKKAKVNYLPENLTDTDLHELLRLSKTSSDTKVLK